MEQLSAEATPVNGSHLAQPHGRRQQRLVQEVQMLSQTWTGVTRTISGTLNLLNTWTLSKSHSRRSLVRHQVNFHKQNKQCTGSANLQLDVTLSHSVARNLHLSTNTEHGLALAAYLADHCVRRYSKQGKLEKPSKPFTRVWDLRHLRHPRLHLSWAICTRAGRTGVGSCYASAACSLAVLGGRLVQPSARNAQWLRL